MGHTIMQEHLKKSDWRAPRKKETLKQRIEKDSKLYGDSKPVTKDNSIKEELFHIIHKAICLINEDRVKEKIEKVTIFDREIGKAIDTIYKEDLGNLRKVLG